MRTLLELLDTDRRISPLPDRVRALQRSSGADRMIRQVRNVLGIVVMAVIAVTAAAGQGVHTPSKDSAERKDILDALRIPVERDLKQKIVFVVENLNVAGAWAFVGGSPQGSDGGQPDYRHTPY